MELFINRLVNILIVFGCVSRYVESSQSFNYERMHNFGAGKKIIPALNYVLVSRYAHPEPLPSTKRPLVAAVRTPYHSIYQGARRENDMRVFRRRFSYEPRPEGHRIVCTGSFDCVISHITVETTQGIPTILRGGVGYRSFVAAAKAKPGDELVGTVQAYCLKRDLERKPGS